MSEFFDVKVKICLVGDISVGKTSLVRRYIMDIFDDTFVSTLGTKISKKIIRINKNNHHYHLTLSIWDVLGQNNFENMDSWAFEGTKGAMLICDLTRKDTLKNTLLWIERVKKVAGEIPFIILANKSDLKNDYEFDNEDLLSFSSKLNLHAYTTSAKLGENVTNTFHRLGDLVIENILQKDSDLFSFKGEYSNTSDFSILKK
ncbi:MAG: Rab family GTPase [Candidatus Thorarchaeota archaeon]